MTRTTPPRPVDVVAVFPELAAMQRQTVRLHPRVGTPAATESSIGGPLLWPGEEPWPMCAGPHVRDRSFLTVPLSTVPGDPTPNAMIPVAQLFTRDLPSPLGLPGFETADLLQVLWCPVDHPETYLPRLHVVWRQAASVQQVLPEPPSPIRVDDYYTPVPCVLHPELVAELPAVLQVPDGLSERIGAWENEAGWDYQDDLSVVPGFKLGGWAPWSFSDPFPISCKTCHAAMIPLFTISSGEWDGDGASWIPVEDRGARPGFAPTGITVGRGNDLQLYCCPNSPAHPVQANLQ